MSDLSASSTFETKAVVHKTRYVYMITTVVCVGLDFTFGLHEWVCSAPIQTMEDVLRVIQEIRQEQRDDRMTFVSFSLLREEWA